jgi:hypothetical protein
MGRLSLPGASWLGHGSALLAAAMFDAVNSACTVDLIPRGIACMAFTVWNLPSKDCHVNLALMVYQMFKTMTMPD